MRDTFRRLLSHVVMGLCGLSVLIALVPLALILFYVLTQGITSLNWSFIVDMPKPVGEPGGGMANAIVGSVIVVSIGAAIRDPDRHPERCLRGGICRNEVRRGRPVLSRHAQRRSVDRDRRFRVRHRRPAVPAILGAGRRRRAGHHDDPAHHADDRGTAAARAAEPEGRAPWRSGRDARTRCVHRRAARRRCRAS